MELTSDDYRAILRDIDAGPFDVTDWEANFIDSVLSHDKPITPKQAKVIDAMRDKYVPF